MKMRRFDASRLRRASGVEVKVTGSQKQDYVEEELERAREDWPEKNGTSSGEVEGDEDSTNSETLGTVRRSQPNWCCKSKDAIKPYLQEMNVAYTTRLASTNRQDVAKFRVASGRARQAERRAGSGGKHRKMREKYSG